ncbi:diphthamide biosynthesis protein [Panus rudis PR-1116 ss-1]|nr:diphthamide biosynthesis protein [Panus rudis PR-1116 ss-1]
MAENTAFAASGEDAITRTIEVQPEGPSDNLSEESLAAFYDIDRTVDEIERGDFKRIALQFPDELLHASVPIYRTLKRRLRPDRELYVLADTSYGRQAYYASICCVDEVAAQHVDADAMVHYGHACMSQTSRLPVIYVFGKKDIDPTDCTVKLVKALREDDKPRQAVLLKFDVAYVHRAEKILAKLREFLDPTTKILYTPIPTKTEPASKAISQPPESLRSPITESTSSNDPECNTILYIGGESLSLTNLIMTHSAFDIYSYDPTNRETRLESARVNKLLMRRYVAVQKARDADVFGILVGTLGVASYLPLISHIRSILKKAHKKSYTVSVGKLNPAKLANFLEIECFVLVACPENSVIEAKEFLRPIITPYELEVALQPEPTWTGKYVLDFNEVLRSHTSDTNGDATKTKDNGEEDEDLDQPVFSLVTGKYRQAKRYGVSNSESQTQVNADTSAVVLRNQDTAVSVLADSAASYFLQNRTYKGLEARIGEDAPSVLEQGRSGIARGYQDDHRE